MPTTHSRRNFCSTMLREARLQVLDKGSISPATATQLENLGFDVGEMERRLLDQQGAAA
jgi:hypothetical protein